MAKAWRVPTTGSDCGKYSFANTSPVTMLYRKKSYHSMVVPTVLAMTARRYGFAGLGAIDCAERRISSKTADAENIVGLAPRKSIHEQFIWHFDAA
jgi:hypothetical protein